MFLRARHGAKLLATWEAVAEGSQSQASKVKLGRYYVKKKGKTKGLGHDSSGRVLV
jgi:hypothetical protein